MSLQIKQLEITLNLIFFFFRTNLFVIGSIIKRITLLTFEMYIARVIIILVRKVVIVIIIGYVILMRRRVYCKRT